MTTNNRSRICVPVPPLISTSEPAFIVGTDEYMLEEFHVVKYFIGVVKRLEKNQSMEGQLIEVGQLFALFTKSRSAFSR